MKEVYVPKGINGEILYVGTGNVGRNAHCLNGTSHNKNLNRYFFTNGEDGCITTEVLHMVETQELSEKLDPPNHNFLEKVLGSQTKGSFSREATL